jgi:hypothetical protein
MGWLASEAINVIPYRVSNTNSFPAMLHNLQCLDSYQVVNDFLPRLVDCAAIVSHSWSFHIVSALI